MINHVICDGTYSTEVYKQKLQNQEIRQRLMTRLASLTTRQQECLRLCYGLDGGLTHTPKQVAQIMGISRSRFYSLHRRAITKTYAVFITK